MKAFSDNEKTIKLEKVIFSLSKKQSIFEDSKEVENYCIELEKIYSSNNAKETFRHNYSDIFGWLAQIDRDASGENGNLDILAQNIEYIKNFYNGWNQHGIGEKDVHKQIGKLYDHINLEIARLNYLKATYEDRKSEIQDINQQISRLNRQTKEETEKAEDIRKKVNNAYSEFVSILGIFSAIVMVFFGGASIFGNVFSGLNNVSIYKSIIICAMTGIMTADIIFIFLLFLSKLLNRSIAVEIPEWQTYSNSIKRFRARYPAVFYFNVMGIVIVTVTGCIWNIGKIKINGNIMRHIIKYISDAIKIDSSKSILLIVLLVLWGIVNILFIIAYVLAKITDINIGKTVRIRTPLFVYVTRMEEKYYLYVEKYPEDKIVKTSTSFRTIRFYEKLYKIKYDIPVKIFNAMVRILRRYPYMTVFNIVILIWIFAIINN